MWRCVFDSQLPVAHTIRAAPKNEAPKAQTPCHCHRPREAGQESAERAADKVRDHENSVDAIACLRDQPVDAGLIGDQIGLGVGRPRLTVTDSARPMKWCSG
jgi:hypothetical protein